MVLLYFLDRIHLVHQVIRHYHGHLSAVYDLDLHPTIDVLVTCSRDATARVSHDLERVLETIYHMRVWEGLTKNE